MCPHYATHAKDPMPDFYNHATHSTAVLFTVGKEGGATGPQNSCVCTCNGVCTVIVTVSASLVPRCFMLLTSPPDDLHPSQAHRERYEHFPDDTTGDLGPHMHGSLLGDTRAAMAPFLAHTWVGRGRRQGDG